jgi:hypothetical protein
LAFGSRLLFAFPLFELGVGSLGDKVKRQFEDVQIFIFRRFEDLNMALQKIEIF